MQNLKDLLTKKEDIKSGSKSERDVIVGDLFNFFEQRGIKLLRRGKISMGHFATLLSPYPTKDLYVFVSKLREAKNPAAMFWWYVKPKK